MPNRGIIYPKGNLNMSERPLTHDEMQELEKLRGALLSSHDLARMLEWRVAHTPAGSLDKITVTRLCKVLNKHAETALDVPQAPTNEGEQS